MKTPNFREMAADLIGNGEALAELRERVGNTFNEIYELGLKNGADTMKQVPRFDETEDSKTVEFECILTNLDVNFWPPPGRQDLTLSINALDKEGGELLAWFCRETFHNTRAGWMKGKMAVPARLALTKNKSDG